MIRLGHPFLTKIKAVKDQILITDYILNLKESLLRHLIMIRLGDPFLTQIKAVKDQILITDYILNLKESLLRQCWVLCTAAHLNSSYQCQIPGC